MFGSPMIGSWSSQGSQAMPGNPDFQPARNPWTPQNANNPGSQGNPWNAQNANNYYQNYLNAQGPAKDAMIRQMQGADNGAAFNAAMKQGGNVLTGGAGGQYGYQHNPAAAGLNQIADMRKQFMQGGGQQPSMGKPAAQPSFQQWSSQQPYPSGKLQPYGPYTNPNSPASMNRNNQLLSQFLNSNYSYNPNLVQY